MILNIFSNNRYSEDISNFSISNITSDSAVISWTTSEATPSKVFLTEKTDGKLLDLIRGYVYRDQRDYEEVAPNSFSQIRSGKYYTHFVTVSGLESEKSYMVSLGNYVLPVDSTKIVFKTYSQPESLFTPKPIYGAIIVDGAWVDNLILRISFTTGFEEKSQELSTLVSNSDTWSLDIANIRTEDGSKLFEFDENTSALIEVSDNDETVSTTVDINSLNPAPTIIIKGDELESAENSDDMSSANLLVNDVNAVEKVDPLDEEDKNSNKPGASSTSKTYSTTNKSSSRLIKSSDRQSTRVTEAKGTQSSTSNTWNRLLANTADKPQPVKADSKSSAEISINKESSKSTIKEYLGRSCNSKTEATPCGDTKYECLEVSPNNYQCQKPGYCYKDSQCGATSTCMNNKCTVKPSGRVSVTIQEDLATDTDKDSATEVCNNKKNCSGTDQCYLGKCITNVEFLRISSSLEDNIVSTGAVTTCSSNFDCASLGVRYYCDTDVSICKLDEVNRVCGQGLPGCASGLSCESSCVGSFGCSDNKDKASCEKSISCSWSSICTLKDSSAKELCPNAYDIDYSIIGGECGQCYKVNTESPSIPSVKADNSCCMDQYKENGCAVYSFGCESLEYDDCISMTDDLLCEWSIFTGCEPLDPNDKKYFCNDDYLYDEDGIIVDDCDGLGCVDNGTKDDTCNQKPIVNPPGAMGMLCNSINKSDLGSTNEYENQCLELGCTWVEKDRLQNGGNCIWSPASIVTDEEPIVPESETSEDNISSEDPRKECLLSGGNRIYAELSETQSICLNRITADCSTITTKEECQTPGNGCGWSASNVGTASDPEYIKSCMSLADYQTHLDRWDEGLCTQYGPVSAGYSAKKSQCSVDIAVDGTQIDMNEIAESISSFTKVDCSSEYLANSGCTVTRTIRDEESDGIIIEARLSHGDYTVQECENICSSSDSDSFRPGATGNVTGMHLEIEVLTTDGQPISADKCIKTSDLRNTGEEGEVAFLPEDLISGGVYDCATGVVPVPIDRDIIIEGPEVSFFDLILGKAQAQEASINDLSLEPGKYVLNVDENNTLSLTESSNIAFFDDENGNGVKDEDERFLSKYEADKLGVGYVKTQSAVDYQFNQGWNLVSFPFVWDVDALSSAEDVLKYLNAKGIIASQISTYREGKFEMFSLTEDGEGTIVPVGNDFTILPGEAYFIKSGNSGSVSILSNAYEGSLEIELLPGWNLVNIYKQDVDSYQAFDVLKQMEGQGVVADTLSKWENSKYNSVVYSDNMEYGYDYKVFPTAGYFVKVLSETGGSYIPE